jgi:hypothetical protein
MKKIGVFIAAFGAFIAGAAFATYLAERNLMDVCATQEPFTLDSGTVQCKIIHWNAQ